MGFLSHTSFGLFTALLVHELTGDVIGALIVFLIQIGLILDWRYKSDFFHTLVAMLGVWVLSLLLFPQYQLYVLFGYFTHLFIDLFVIENIFLLWPWKKTVTFPTPYSEKAVTFFSFAGCIFLLLL